MVLTREGGGIFIRGREAVVTMVTQVEAGIEEQLPRDSSQQGLVDLLLPLGRAVGLQFLSDT